MAEQQKCVVCGYAFMFDAEFYASRQLRAPLRCVDCRAARRRTLATRWGVCSSAGRFAFLREDGSCNEFFVSRPPTWLRAGLRVTFWAGAEETPGRRPPAYELRKE